MIILYSFPLETVPTSQQPSTQLPPDTASPILILPPPVPTPPSASRPVETAAIEAPGMGSVPTEPDDEEGLKHLEQVKSGYSIIYSQVSMNIPVQKFYALVLSTGKNVWLFNVYVSNCLSDHFMLLSFCYVVVIMSGYFLLF